MRSHDSEGPRASALQERDGLDTRLLEGREGSLMQECVE
jgi:hypothetical protein